MLQLTYQDVLRLLEAEEGLVENPLQEAVLIGQIDKAVERYGVDWVKAHCRRLISRFKYTKRKL